MSEEPILRLEGMSKRYGGTVALDGVHFAARRSSIHAILGVAGVLLITLMSSILSILQAPEAAKQIAYGLVIIAMVDAYSRRRAS